MEEYKIEKLINAGQYILLDSGEGAKLERFGNVIVARPDPQALWRKNLSEAEWGKANAYFKRDARRAEDGASRRAKTAQWQTRGNIPERWPIEIGGLKMWIKLSAFKHVGIFPEQVPNWNWIREKVNGKPVKILNLFGYTGGATLACVQAGAEVVHVDGSKVAIGWARDNATLSGLQDKPIRWILDDATTFVKREVKRGNKYDAIIMDPPAFGHGPKRELWEIEDSFLPLLDLCKQLLSDQPIFFIVNGYASGYSALAYQNSLGDLLKPYGGQIEIGELTIAEQNSSRLLPAGIFARWSLE